MKFLVQKRLGCCRELLVSRLCSKKAENGFKTKSDPNDHQPLPMKIKDSLLKNCRLAVRDFAGDVDIANGSVDNDMKDILDLKGVKSRLIS